MAANLDVRAPEWTPTQPLVIDNNEDYRLIAERLRLNKTFQHAVATFFRPLKEKAHAAWQALCEAERKHLAPAQAEERRDKAALASYASAQEHARQLEERRRNEAACAAEATHRAELETAAVAEAAELEALGHDHEAAAILAAASTAPIAPAVFVPSQTPKVAGLAWREVWHAEVLDLRRFVQAAALDSRWLPYLTINTSALNALARTVQNREPIPGVRVYVERLPIATRST